MANPSPASGYGGVDLSQPGKGRAAAIKAAAAQLQGYGNNVGESPVFLPVQLVEPSPTTGLAHPTGLLPPLFQHGQAGHGLHRAPLGPDLLNQPAQGMTQIHPFVQNTKMSDHFGVGGLGAPKPAAVHLVVLPPPTYIQTQTASLPPPAPRQSANASSRVGKPSAANTDGYCWRKYGEKVVKGSPNPRSYYKCSHAGCGAKKIVERDSKGDTLLAETKGEHNHAAPLGGGGARGGSGGGAGSRAKRGGGAGAGGMGGASPEPAYEGAGPSFAAAASAWAYPQDQAGTGGGSVGSGGVDAYGQQLLSDELALTHEMLLRGSSRLTVPPPSLMPIPAVLNAQALDNDDDASGVSLSSMAPPPSATAPANEAAAALMAAASVLLNAGVQQPRSRGGSQALFLPGTTRDDSDRAPAFPGSRPGNVDATPH
ncbi:hypothetical protein FOA52_013661 [Chlamydomonas sp. UWO 241]|nr:hypothetical protein FOA52_013661 [Chlamydomonas sp. UWO 241]